MAIWTFWPVCQPAPYTATVQEVLCAIFLIPPPDSPHSMERQSNLITLGGRITCPRCQAMSKRTRKQCGAPAMKGKRVCRTHGGRSTGPKTEQGRQRCAAANTVHGRDTRQIRQARRQAIATLAQLEALGFALGIMKGTRTRGPKPNSKKLDS